MSEKYAIAGIKHYIQHKKKFIQNLLDNNQPWNKGDDIVSKSSQGFAEHLANDVAYFEHLLKLIEEKKKSKDNPKISEIPQLDPKIKAEIERQVQLQVSKALKKKHDSKRKKKSL